MGRADPILTEEAFAELLQTVSSRCALVAEATAAQVRGQESGKDPDAFDFARAVFRTHHRLPFKPFFDLATDGLIREDLLNLARGGFSNEALLALRPALFAAYSYGFLYGWETHKALSDPPKPEAPDGT